MSMRIYNDFNLSNYNSYRLNAICKTAYFPDSERELINLYRSGKKFILIGSGHNIILSKEYYNEEFIIFNGNFNNISIDGNSGLIQAEAGIRMEKISELACEEGLSGLEVFYDIPSSLGGAVVMNAGASGEEIKDVLIKIRYLDLDDMQIKEVLNERVFFEYRDSFFQRNTNKIILKAWLKLTNKPKALIREKMESLKSQRWSKHPKEYPNAGSVFKRPNGFYVGALIDELNLKGYSIGGAKISEKHGGFIINFSCAKGSDILEIIEEVKRRVYDLYQIELEVEQRVI